MMRKFAGIVFGVALLGAVALAQTPKPLAARVRGLVFIVDDDAGRSAIAAGKVVLAGPAHTIDDVAALDSLTKGDKGENNVERGD